jgi:hypothetical protein
MSRKLIILSPIENDSTVGPTETTSPATSVPEIKYTHYICYALIADVKTLNTLTAKIPNPKSHC